MSEYSGGVVVSDKDVFKMIDILKDKVSGEILMKGLAAGGILLRDSAKQRLYKKMPIASKAVGREKDNITMLEGIRVHKVEDENAVNVYILNNFMNRWFELGTDDRHLLRGHYFAHDRIKREGKYRKFKKNESRGKITALHFFRDAREQDMGKVMDKIIEVIDKQIEKVIDE